VDVLKMELQFQYAIKAFWPRTRTLYQHKLILSFQRS
jgi:hypothetical protein